MDRCVGTPRMAAYTRAINDTRSMGTPDKPKSRTESSPAMSGLSQKSAQAPMTNVRAEELMAVPDQRRRPNLISAKTRMPMTGNETNRVGGKHPASWSKSLMGPFGSH